MIVRPLAPNEVNRLDEIDVSESGRIIYRHADGRLDALEEVWQRPAWGADDWDANLETWTLQLKTDLMLGAFAGGKLLGIAFLRHRLTDATAQLVALYVSRQARRQGVATQLADELIRQAKLGGARELYVSATPSESAVGFYLKLGFRPAAQVNADLYTLEPEDIHMVRPL